MAKKPAKAPSINRILHELRATGKKDHPAFVLFADGSGAIDDELLDPRSEHTVFEDVGQILQALRKHRGE